MLITGNKIVNKVDMIKYVFIGHIIQEGSQTMKLHLTPMR